MFQVSLFCFFFRFIFAFDYEKAFVWVDLVYVLNFFDTIRDYNRGFMSSITISKQFGKNAMLGKALRCLANRTSLSKYKLFKKKKNIPGFFIQHDKELKLSQFAVAPPPLFSPKICQSFITTSQPIMLERTNDTSVTLPWTFSLNLGATLLAVFSFNRMSRDNYLNPL